MKLYCGFEQGAMVVKSSVKQKLGHIIKINRNLRGFSQQKLSKSIIYNQSVISKVERGHDTIHMMLYIKLLKYFKLNYVENTKLEDTIHQITEEVYEVFLYLKNDKIKGLMGRIKTLQQENRNAIYHYDLLVLELVLLFLLSEHDKCQEMIKYLSNFYTICSETCQLCFIYVNNYYIVRYQNGENINILKLNDTYLDKADGFLDYIYGWCYYHDFNYSKAIFYLHQSINKLKKNNNIYRVIRCEIIINEILLLDKHYRDVYERTKQLIEEYQLLNNNEDYLKLMFHLGYSAYYLKDYEQAKNYFEQLIRYNTLPDYHFYKYMYVKCLDKLNLDINYDISYRLKINKENILMILYLHKLQDKKYYQWIEDYIVPFMKNEYYKTEYQYYSLMLLDYYWMNKKYRKYRKLNEQIHEILHIS